MADGASEVFGLGQAGVGRYHECGQHGGNRGVDTGHQKRSPDAADAQQTVENNIFDTHFVGREHHCEESHAHAEIDERNL